MENEKTFWQRLWTPTKVKLLLGIPVGGFVAVIVGVIALGSFNGIMHATNENEFCYGCHIGMDTIVEEYQESIHFKNEYGIQAGCSDCHVPKEFFPKMKVKIVALKDVYHMIAGTYNLENFEEHRNELAHHVYEDMKARDSKECKNCHNPENMDFAAQPKRASLNHDVERMAKRGETCVDCHPGIAHKRPVIQ